MKIEGQEAGSDGHQQGSREPPAFRPLRVPRFVRWLALGIALVLFISALLMVWHQRETVLEAARAVDRPEPVLLLLLLGSVLVSLVLSGTAFLVLIRRFGHVGFLEMQALVATSGLLNYLPLRPGMVGRVAYHRQVNAIPILQSSRTVVEAAAISLAMAVALALAAASSLWLGWSLWIGAIMPAGLLAIGLLMPAVRIYAICGLLRYGDVMVWAVRYYAAFGLIGSPLAPEAALAFAATGTIATMVPLISNGLGLREWAVGLLSPVLTSYQLTLGLTAELINRAAEVLVVVTAGMISFLWLAPRWRAAHE